MKGDKMVIYYGRGKTGQIKKKYISKAQFSEFGIECPNRKCRGFIFPDRMLKRSKHKTTKFGTCAMCETFVTIPRESGKIKTDYSKSSLLKSLQINLDAYYQKCCSM